MSKESTIAFSCPLLRPKASVWGWVLGLEMWARRPSGRTVFQMAYTARPFGSFDPSNRIYSFGFLLHRHERYRRLSRLSIAKCRRIRIVFEDWKYRRRSP